MGLFNNLFKRREQPDKVPLGTPYSAPKAAAAQPLPSAPPAPLQLSPEQFTGVSLISTGTNAGNVYSAVDSATGQHVAIKVYDSPFLAEAKPNTYIGGVPFTTGAMPYEARVLQTLAGIAYFPSLVGVGNQRDSRFNRQGVDFLVEDWIESVPDTDIGRIMQERPDEIVELFADAMLKAYERGFCIGDTEFRIEGQRQRKQRLEGSIGVPRIQQSIDLNKLSEYDFVPRLFDVGGYLPTPEAAQLPKNLPPVTRAIMGSAGTAVADFLRLASAYSSVGGGYFNPEGLRREIQGLETGESPEDLNFGRLNKHYRALKTLEQMIQKSRSGEYGAFSDDSHARGGGLGGYLLPADVRRTAGDGAKLQEFVRDLSIFIYHMRHSLNPERLCVV